MTDKTLALGILLVFCTVACAWADVVYLKNGRYMEGVVIEETDGYIQLAVGIGTVKFNKTQIEEIDRSSREENQGLADSWERERVRKEREQKKLQNKGIHEIAITREENHAFVSSVLNKETEVTLALDTGASLVVLSSETASQLKIDLASAKPDVKMLLANGKEAPAKLITLESVAVGDAEVKNVDAAIILSKNAFKKFGGLLGMSFLKSFKFELDLEAKTLVLEERKSEEDEG